MRMQGIFILGRGKRPIQNAIHRWRFVAFRLFVSSSYFFSPRPVGDFFMCACRKIDGQPFRYGRKTRDTQKMFRFERRFWSAVKFDLTENSFRIQFTRLPLSLTIDWEQKRILLLCFRSTQFLLQKITFFELFLSIFTLSPLACSEQNIFFRYFSIEFTSLNQNSFNRTTESSIGQWKRDFDKNENFRLINCSIA